MLVWGGLTAATAQDSARGILGIGSAAVSGFSGGVQSVPSAAARRQCRRQAAIDPDGPRCCAPSITCDMGGPPQGQVVAPAKPLTITSGRIGQTFAVTLDDANPPNIYAAATSAYGLPIVGPDADRDGVPDRLRRGAPNAAFMPGLFGPAGAGGGPGSIWKIDARSGAVRLFANVTLDGVPNPGPALGGLTFDAATRQIFVADRATGTIHRFGLDGGERGRFDHGAQALGAVGLPPIPFDPRRRLDIQSPAFDSENPATWGTHCRRAGCSGSRFIAAGSTTPSPRARASGRSGLRPMDRSDPTPASKSSCRRVSRPVPKFRKSCSMAMATCCIAERGAPTGAYDFGALTAPDTGRVIRLRSKAAGAGGTPFLWEPVGDYAIGFSPDSRNGDGGIALGNGHDPSGFINPGVCGAMLWTTGSQLRVTSYPPLVQWLAAGGPFAIDGLQGNATAQLRQPNTPPFRPTSSISTIARSVAGTPGHMGDVAIWRVCGAVALAPLPLACPPGTFNVGGACLFALACPLGTVFAAGHCVYPGCPPSYVSIGGRCVPPPLNCKPNETYWDGRCEPPKCRPGLDPVDDGNAQSPADGG